MYIKYSIVDAVLFDGDLKEGWVEALPGWFRECVRDGKIEIVQNEGRIILCSISNGNKRIRVDKGSYIVNNDGVIYSTNKETFERLYKEIDSVPECLKDTSKID